MESFESLEDELHTFLNTAIHTDVWSISRQVYFIPGNVLPVFIE
jgi:hypothetical protein